VNWRVPVPAVRALWWETEGLSGQYDRVQLRVWCLSHIYKVLSLIPSTPTPPTMKRKVFCRQVEDLMGEGDDSFSVCVCVCVCVWERESVCNTGVRMCRRAEGVRVGKASKGRLGMRTGRGMLLVLCPRTAGWMDRVRKCFCKRPYDAATGKRSWAVCGLVLSLIS
jgi:hypothetical protein